MLNRNTKSTSVKAGRPALLGEREATAGRGLQASRRAPAGTRAASPALAPAASPSSASADRIGAAVTFLLSLGLVAGGSLMVAQIWSNLAMIR